MTRCILKRVSSRLQVRAPYSPEFVKKAEEMAGRWKRRTGLWSFDVRQYESVKVACLEVYGHIEGWAPPEDL